MKKRPSQSTTALSLLLLSVGFTGCGSAVDLRVSRTFQEAQTAFNKADDAEDFLRCAGLYQEILDSGVVSGAVLYNQGNAFVRAGHPGRAIAAYRRATRYRTRDPMLAANLNYALGVDGPEARRRPVIETILFWQDWLSYPEKFYLALAAAMVTFGLATTALFARRRLLNRAAIGCLAVTGLLIVSAAYDWYRFDFVEHGVVAVPEAIARKGNAAGYEPAFTEALTEGTEFQLVQRRDNWILIRMPAGAEGWVEEEDVALY